MDRNTLQRNNLAKYLPSKTILVTILVLGLAGISYWATPRIKERYLENRAAFSVTGKPPAPLLATTATPTNFDKDTDGDSIPDWQENLFGFDPTKNDTDGDGIPDSLPTNTGGQSISELIDLPAIDKLTLAVYAEFQNTPTDAITEEQFKEKTSAQILAQAQSIEDGLKKYRTVDLNLGDSDKASILAYQASIMRIVESVPDGALFAKNIQEKVLKGTAIGSFEINFLNQTITKLLAMSVPARFSDLHLKFLNSTYYIIQILEIPASTDELTTYTLSLIAQKNINLISQTAGDINNIASIYNTYD